MMNYTDAGNYDPYADEDDPFGVSQPAPAPTAPPPSSGNYPLAPSEPPPPGTQWMLNPTTRQYEAIQIGQMPPWGAIFSQPGTPAPTASPTPPAYTPPTEYDYGGGGFSGPTNPTAGFQFPTYDAPTANFREFGGFKPFTPPSEKDILSDPVLQAQLSEGNRRIKQDRAFKGIFNTGDTLRDLFDWTSDRIKLGGHDAFNRAFQVYDVNDRQNPFNTWSANKDLYFQQFDRNASGARDEFQFNQYEPAKMRFEDAYRQWSKTGDWLNTPVTVPD